MLCPKCGQAISDAERICPSCGAELDAPNDSAPAAEPETAAEPAGEVLPETAADPVSDAAEAPAEVAEVTEAVSGEPESPTEAAGPEAAEGDTESPLQDELPAREAGDAEAESEGTESEGTEFEGTEAEGTRPKKKDRGGWIAIGAVVVLALIIGACVFEIFHSRSGGKSSMNPSAVAVEVFNEDGAQVAQLTNEELSFYYWGEYYYFLQSYGMAFDPSLPLSEQEYGEGETWEDYFMESALNSIQQTFALKLEAEAAGFEMPEEYQAQYDETISYLSENALYAGFADSEGGGDVLAYIKDSYGPDATEESFYAYLYDSYYVTAYSGILYDEDGTFTDQELSDYYDENADLFSAYGIEKTDQPDIDVRHILIAPTDLELEPTEEEQAQAKADAEAEAQRIYQEWQDGEATEESFGELANQYSTDGGSNTNGGLYADVYPGQMVPAFNDWCFDESRQPGDTGIVETDFGYHIMYFVGTTDRYYWKETIADELRYDRYVETMDGLVAKYTAMGTDKLTLVTPDAVNAIMEQYAAETAVSSTEE